MTSDYIGLITSLRSCPVSVLQRHNDNLLQQTMLRSLRNQVSFFGGGPRSRSGPNSLVNQLSENVNRMTQSMMDRMTPRVLTRPSVLTDNTLNTNTDIMPVDVLMRQQQTLQDMLNVRDPSSPQQQQTILVVPVGQNEQWGSTLTDTLLPQMSRNGVNIVMVERNETSGTNQPTVTRTTTTRIGDPTMLQNSSVDSIFSRIRAPGTVTSFLTGTPEGKISFNELSQPNSNNIVNLPGSGSFIVVDGNSVDPQSVVDSAVPVQSPPVDTSNRNIDEQNIPFGGRFPTRNRQNGRKRSGANKKPGSTTRTTQSQSTSTKLVTPADRTKEAEVTQPKARDMGVPVNIDIAQTLTPEVTQSSGLDVVPTMSSMNSPLIYSQDSVKLMLIFLEEVKRTVLQIVFKFS